MISLAVAMDGFRVRVLTCLPGHDDNAPCFTSTGPQTKKNEPELAFNRDSVNRECTFFGKACIMRMHGRAREKSEREYTDDG